MIEFLMIVGGVFSFFVVVLLVAPWVGYVAEGYFKWCYNKQKRMRQ